ncbi:tRNA pseudouridine(38-40) synthase TruA [Flavobacteriaceae bacterium Ap0902]|nr:tRNA pseudouridine(38-40) synthase TruA [Flavobacteriaceae bacterium Ap0902]
MVFLYFKSTKLRYFITLAYNGNNYHGWQIQPNAITVQEILEDRISKLLGINTPITAAGRTDTGVHASKMVVHIDASIPDKENFIYRLNAFLPTDIAIHSIEAVRDDAHARFNALERTYQYFLHYDKNPFIPDVSWHWRYTSLGIKAMNEAATYLLQTEDFTSFARLHADNKTNICDVRQAFWKETREGLKFTISADRFLRNMVRAIVGTLVEVGRGKLNKKEFIEIIHKKDRSFAAASAPAHGLFITNIEYPDDIYL